MGKGNRNRARRLSSISPVMSVGGESTYTVEAHPWGGVLWRISDRDLAVTDRGSALALVAAFIAEHPHDDFTLSIYDTMMMGTIEIDCKVAEMPNIVEYIYHLEKGTLMGFIGENLLSDSYVVGMRITRGRLDAQAYRADGGKLIPIPL